MFTVQMLHISTHNYVHIVHKMYTHVNFSIVFLQPDSISANEAEFIVTMSNRFQDILNTAITVVSAVHTMISYT